MVSSWAGAGSHQAFEEWLRQPAVPSFLLIGADAADVQVKEVCLADVPEKALRLFENHLFRYAA